MLIYPGASRALRVGRSGGSIRCRQPGHHNWHPLTGACSPVPAKALAWASRVLPFHLSAEQVSALRPLTPITEWSCWGSTRRCCALENTTPMLLVRPEKTSPPSLAFFPPLLKETDAHLEKITFGSEMYEAEKQKPTTVPRDNDNEQPPRLSADYRAWHSLSSAHFPIPKPPRAAAWHSTT